MTVIYPEATPAYGNTSVTAVLTIAAPTAPDLSSEVNAVSSVDVSCYLYGDFSASSNTNKGNAPQRLCTTDQLEQLGSTTYTVADLQYLYDPQEDDADEANKAKVTLAEGVELWLVERNGLSAREVDKAAGQLVNLHHVRLGKQNRTKAGDGEFTEYSITQSVIYIEPPVFDVALVA